jgi:predicted RNase H-like HicB family nuclease
MKDMIELLSSSSNNFIPFKFDRTSNPSSIIYKISLKEDEDGWIIATSPDLPSLITQGKTEDEVIKNVLDVIRLFIDEKYIESSNKYFLVVS